MITHQSGGPKRRFSQSVSPNVNSSCTCWTAASAIQVGGETQVAPTMVASMTEKALTIMVVVFNLLFVAFKVVGKERLNDFDFRFSEKVSFERGTKKRVGLQGERVKSTNDRFYGLPGGRFDFCPTL